MIQDLRLQVFSGHTTPTADDGGGDDFGGELFAPTTVAQFFQFGAI
jgi:hypothetical protein